MRILFVAPAYWPAYSFGGPISVMRKLAEGLVGRGHTLEVMTTSVVDLDTRSATSRRSATVDGAVVHYLGTPLRYRWMGVTPSLWRALSDVGRPDVIHVFGFRDFVGTISARWARKQGVPYLFEGLGMVRPKLRKLALKRTLDATVYRGVLRGARLLVAASERERDEYVDAGIAPGRIEIRPNGFPDAVEPRPAGLLRSRIGIDESTPLVLSVGRVARGKGLELLVRTVASLRDVHVAIIGPDDGHGMVERLTELRTVLGLDDRLHLVGPVAHDELPGMYVDADVCVLASAHENFGMVAAEAASLGVPVVVSDRCGIAELLRAGGGMVVPYDEVELRAALERVLTVAEFRQTLAARGRAVALEWSWPRVVRLQEELYHRALAGG